MTRLKNRASDHGRHRNIHPVGQRQVPQDHGRTADSAMRANASTASHADATGHGRVRANMHVVANLYQIVEFDAVLDHSVIQRATVNAGIGADFDIMANAHSA